MNHDLVINHNALDTAIYNMSVIELKLMHYCITKVRRDGGYDEKNRHFEISHDEFAKKIGRENCYNSIKSAAIRLQQRIIIINTPIIDDDGTKWDGGAISVLSAQKWREGDGVIKLSFSPEFMPYLTKLAGEYNKLFFQDIGNMKGEYGIRLYKLIRNHYNMNKKYARNDNLLVEVTTLREALKLGTKYTVNYDFKKYVILRAVDDINQHSPLFVECEQVKKGKRIHSYAFKITDKSKPISAKSKAAKAVQKVCDDIKKSWESGKKIKIGGELVIDFCGALVTFKSGSTNLFALVKKGVEISIEK